MSLTWSCLTIGKNTYVKTINGRLSKSFTFFKNFFLSRISSKHIIKMILSVTLSSFNLTGHFIRYLDHMSISSRIFWIYGSYSCKHSNLTFHVFNFIVELSTFLNFFFVLLFTNFHIFNCRNKFLLKLSILLFRLFCLSWLNF